MSRFCLLLLLLLSWGAGAAAPVGAARVDSVLAVLRGEIERRDAYTQQKYLRCFPFSDQLECFLVDCWSAA